MASTNLNIRTDKEIKEQADKIYNELGLTMTTAINMFLRATIRDKGIPFELKLSTQDDITMSAIEEGRKIARDKNIKGYKNIQDLRKSLEI